MDDLSAEIAKTNELLQELLSRENERKKRSEANKIDWSARREKLHEEVEASRANRLGVTGDHEQRMAEIRERTERARQQQEEYQQKTIQLLEEQNALLEAILGKL